MNKDLNRVSDSIDGLILTYLRQFGWNENKTFYISDLARFVLKYRRCSPSSPDRILRKLRDEFHIDYEILDKSKGKALLKSIRTEAEVTQIHKEKYLQTSMRM